MNHIFLRRVLSVLALMFAIGIALDLTGCASLPKPRSDKQPQPILRKGWNYIESEKEILDLDAGQDPLSYSAPVLAGEKLIFGSERFGITVLAKKNGRKLWQRNLDGPVSAQPLVSENLLFAGSEAGTLYSFDLEGNERWKVPLSAPIRGSFLMAFQRLFVATADEGLYAMDPSTGKVLWNYRRPAFGGTSVFGGGNPAAVNGKIWMGFSDGSLLALHPETGAVESEKVFRDSLKFTDIDARVVGWRDGMFVSTYDAKLRYLRKDGSTAWEFKSGGARAPVLSDGDVIYFPSSDGSVYALSGNTGKEIWNYALHRGVPTGLSLVTVKQRKLLLLAGSEEKVIVLDALTGQALAQSSLGRGSGTYGPMAVDSENNSFYVLSQFSRIYEFHLNL